MSNNIEKTKGFIHMDSRIWPEFRQQVYNYLKAKGYIKNK